MSFNEKVKQNMAQAETNKVVRRRQEARFDDLIKKLRAAKNYIQTRAVLFERNGIEDELKKANNNEYIFTFKDRETFNALYADLKEEHFPAYEKHQKKVIKEVEHAIKKSDSEPELRAIKKAIYDEDYLDKKVITQPLMEACDKKIQEAQKAA